MNKITQNKKCILAMIDALYIGGFIFYVGVATAIIDKL